MASQKTSGAHKLELYQFAFSHFNEKARWALDWKGLTATKHSLLPGFHARRAQALTGISQVPILVVDGEAVGDSTAILRRLEQLQPSPPLFPTDAAQLASVMEWISWLDDEVGPSTRLGLFDEIFDDPSTAGDIFSTSKTGLKRAAYKLMIPKIIPVLRGRMSISRDTAKEANEATAKALDRIAAAVEATGYLVGDQFTAADLTAACLLFPLSFPAELPFEMPTRNSAALDNWKSRWSGHGGVAWMEEMFRKHRRCPRHRPI